MQENKIVEILEGLNIPSDKIEEVISSMKEKEYPRDDINGKYDTFQTLKEEIEKETDWRKKASLAAKLISIGLE